MPKLTSKPKSKAIKKSNHRIFGIVFSALIIIALLAMIPLTLMSLKNEKGTDERSQASGGNLQVVDIDDGERVSINNTFYINSRPGVSSYINFNGTFVDNLTKIGPGQYEFDIQYYADKVMGRGFFVALVCNANQCQNAAGTGTVGVNEVVHMVNPSHLGTNYHRVKSVFNLAKNDNYIVRVFANDGTDVHINFIKLKNTQSGRQLLVNDSFNEKVSKTVRRKNGDTANVKFSISPVKPAANSIVTFLDIPHIFLFNSVDVTPAITTPALSIPNNKEYIFETRYFVSKKIIYSRPNLIIYKIVGDEVKNLGEVDLEKQDCNQESGQGCSIKYASITANNGSDGNISSFKFSFNSTQDLLVDWIRIKDKATGQAVYFEDFKNIPEIDRIYEVPKSWYPTSDWQWVYGSRGGRS